MSLANVLIIITIMGGMICALVGIIYRILSKRIDDVSIVHNKLVADISSIRTDICWIKEKLKKI